MLKLLHTKIEFLRWPTKALNKLRVYLNCVFKPFQRAPNLLVTRTLFSRSSEDRLRSLLLRAAS